MEGEEIERVVPGGRRPPAREASVPPAGTRRRAAERLERLVLLKSGTQIITSNIVLYRIELQNLSLPSVDLGLLLRFNQQ